jgi:hypothetical protein
MPDQMGSHMHYCLRSARIMNAFIQTQLPNITDYYYYHTRPTNHDFTCDQCVANIYQEYQF